MSICNNSLSDLGLRCVLFEYLISCIAFIFLLNVCVVLVEAFQQTDSEFLETESNTEHEYDAGSTASTAVLVGDRLLVANVGDSRAVACRDGKGNNAED